MGSVGLKQRRWKDRALRIGPEGLQGQIPQGTRKQTDLKQSDV